MYFFIIQKKCGKNCCNPLNKFEQYNTNVKLNYKKNAHAIKLKLDKNIYSCKKLNMKNIVGHFSWWFEKDWR